MKKLEKLDELIAAMPDMSEPREDEFTVDEWMERKGYPRNQNGRQKAYRDLTTLLDEGQLTVRKGKVGHKRANIYKITA